MKQSLKDPFLILLLAVGIFLIFANLGNIYLWQDEAETAQVAKNTLRYGYPRGYDGKNVLRVTGGFGPNSVWIYHSWLQFYLTALSFFILGINTFAARIPFAFLGFLSILLTYRLSWRLFENRNIARISTLFLVCCVPFLLHIRQCRYYALTIFTVLLTLLCYFQFVERRRFSTAKFVVCFILLFHSNHGVFFPIFIALFLHYAMFHFNRKDLKRLLSVWVLVFLFTLPWIFLCKSWHHGQDALFFKHVKLQLGFYLRVINKYLFPLIFFSAIFVLHLAIKRKRPALPRYLEKSRFWLIVLVIAANMAFLSYVEQRHFRYIVHLIPLFFIIEAIILWEWFKINKYLTTVVILILLLSNALNNPKLRFPIFEYLYELTHNYDGPNEGIVKFLQLNALPTDTVKVPYGDRPIIFYTDLFVDNRPFFQNETYPEWIIFRKDWFEEDEMKKKYMQQISQRYQKIVIDYPDIMWGNRPEPGYHKFRTVTNYPKVTIYKKKN